jgi:hypothetical protein
VGEIVRKIQVHPLRGGSDRRQMCGQKSAVRIPPTKNNHYTLTPNLDVFHTLLRLVLLSRKKRSREEEQAPWAVDEEEKLKNPNKNSRRSPPCATTKNIHLSFAKNHNEKV